MKTKIAERGVGTTWQTQKGNRSGHANVRRGRSCRKTDFGSPSQSCRALYLPLGVIGMCYIFTWGGRRFGGAELVARLGGDLPG